jgi:hypothetical protein
LDGFQVLAAIHGGLINASIFTYSDLGFYASAQQHSASYRKFPGAEKPDCGCGNRYIAFDEVRGIWAAAGFYHI